ncbi:pantothenate kinase [Anabaena sp. UHCC 0399]|uniref:pantothenate kinase n=1 Tax=Anabaena sp. UHCC 0399 TaxID=3110238 RepID=UPI002B1F800D|nr:pantothenate kinase [Anabaena sp. UHCC 0399]MEA5564058.1 pantothenate kinase [Anabaena sp. UHCC 0399]
MKPYQHPTYTENIWLALEIGNSRLHWALFTDESLDCTWDTDYLPESVIQMLAHRETLNGSALAKRRATANSEKLQGGSPSGKTSVTQHWLNAALRLTALPIVIASVVPKQTAFWQTYPNVHVTTLDQIPLKNIYPTLGIDRALALWGAGMTWGFPMLVIDAGTALTFTGADAEQCLVGGAILPGVGLQLASLGQKTGQLPQLSIEAIQSLPQRFALNTPEAIQSGVIYTLLAGIKDFLTDWWQLFPNGKVAIKGGDRTLLLNYLQALYPEIAARLIVEPNLIFWGMQKIVI